MTSSLCLKLSEPTFQLTPSPISLQQVLVEEAKALGPTGADRVQFVMEANQGQTRGTVDAVASSGEKSRLLLLLETLLPPPQASSTTELGRRTASMDGDVDNDKEAYDATIQLRADGVIGTSGSGGARVAPCAVLYDEIDAHVGGRTAVAVGSLLANQGRDSQVSNTNMALQYVGPDADVGMGSIEADEILAKYWPFPAPLFLPVSFQQTSIVSANRPRRLRSVLHQCGPHFVLYVSVDLHIHRMTCVL